MPHSKRSDPRKAGRIKSLDGLRGLAALVVVAHHMSLTVPWFSNRADYSIVSPQTKWNSFHYLLEYTPVHLFYGGNEAVYVFFVISGYVLVYAVRVRSRIAYLASRLARLYIPIWCSLFGAAALVYAWPRIAKINFSSWVNSHAMSFSLINFGRDLYTVDGVSQLNSSLWSMKYEIIFSISILLYAVLLKSRRRYQFKDAIGPLLLLEIFALHFNLVLIKYLCFFLAGSMLHFTKKSKRNKELFLLLPSLVFLYLPWILVGLGRTEHLMLAQSGMLLGATLLVEYSLSGQSKFHEMLESAPVQKLGKSSYSLYLIHAPVLLTVWYLLGPTYSHVGWLARTLLAGCLILITTSLFYRYVELPSKQFSKFIELRISTSSSSKTE